MITRRPDMRRALRTARKELRKKPQLLALALTRIQDEYVKAKQGLPSMLDPRR